ncbi:hypothetical protein RIF29_41398 [Crotalaria pallida]|uniref:Uncharacterized protein n=1 Tax=Crotalaria pallida TaxID=3830 RepID=A0AAN9E4Z7_CROPI
MALMKSGSRALKERLFSCCLEYNPEFLKRVLPGEAGSTAVCRCFESALECGLISGSDPYGNDLLAMLLSEMLQKKRGNGKLVMVNAKHFSEHEISALLLTWTVMMLASNPLWQDKVRGRFLSLAIETDQRVISALYSVITLVYLQMEVFADRTIIHEVAAA